MFTEGEEGRDIHFINNGKVSLVQKSSYSFIAELHKEMSFGEIGFFSDSLRQVSIKATDYTETLIISLNDFLNTANQYSQESIVMLINS